MFNRTKMNDKEVIEQENGSVDAPVVNDKRRFNEQGERIREDEPANAPQRSPREAQLEAELAAEIERREAAESKLVGVQAKFEEVKAGLEAETAELRTRMRKTLEDRADQSRFNFLLSLLPVLDNLNRAVAASETDPSVESFRSGVIGTARSFEQALANVGVAPIPTVGEMFDPEIHEAIDMKEVDADDDGKVTAEYSAGYKFGDRLLRPARVQVGNGSAKTAA
jgi:molecular chaperone GrpE